MNTDELNGMVEMFGLILVFGMAGIYLLEIFKWIVSRPRHAVEMRVSNRTCAWTWRRAAMFGLKILLNVLYLIMAFKLVDGMFVIAAIPTHSWWLSLLLAIGPACGLCALVTLILTAGGNPNSKE